MELRLLQYFLTLCEKGNITAASKELHITQPALSKQLMNLESELGQVLFLRGSRRIELTEYGHLLRNRAQDIIALSTKTMQEFRATNDDISGNLYIGSGETYDVRLFFNIIKKLRERYPGINIRFLVGNADMLFEQLEQQLLDFALFVGTYDFKNHAHIELPSVNMGGLLMKKDHPLAVKERIRPSDIVGIPIICTEYAITKSGISGWMQDDLDKLNVVVTTNLIYSAVPMVEAGIGCAIVTNQLINLEAEGNLCFRPFFPKLGAHLNVIWKKESARSRVAEKFKQFLSEELEKT